jgi:site-specific DNA-cytosine methylase
MRDYTAFYQFAGLGGFSLGFKRAGFRQLGAVDYNAEACKDHQTIVGEPATCADISEMLPADLRELTHGESPDVLVTSPPCKAFSGCLPEARARTDKYQELSNLSQLGIWLALEAWSDDPPSLIVMENVPRIMSRGREWLDQTEAMLRSYGYAVQETTHDCGELGGLAQSRRRFLMVARHTKKVPEFLYEPPKKRVRGVGEVLANLPLPVPEQDVGGPLHHLPRLSPLNWLRLATIRAGHDWHDLPDEIHVSTRASRLNGGYGVNDWTCPAHTVVGEGSIQNTWASVSDPRLSCAPRSGAYGVTAWSSEVGTVVAAACHDNGAYSVADPRVTCHRREGSLGVKDWTAPATAIIAHGTIHNHPSSVRDPRCDEYTHALAELGDKLVLFGPALDLESRRSAEPVPLIRALDGDWHRPMTTLELAALQGLPTKIDGEWLELAGRSHKRWRQRIGNAVPPAAAEAIADSCLATLDAAENDTFLMSGQPVWVEPDEPRPQASV